MTVDYVTRTPQGDSMARRSSVGPRLAAGVVLSLFVGSAHPAAAQDSVRTDSSGRPAVTRATLQAALDLMGLTYSDSEVALLLRPRGQVGNDFMGRGDRRNAYDSIRAVALENADVPALFFQPLPPAVPIPDRRPRFADRPRQIRRPAKLEDVAFWL